MAASHSQSPDHSLLLGRLPQATTSWSMPHGRMPLATTSQSMPHGRMPLAIASQSMPHGRLPLPVSKNRDEHAIMPLGCLPLSYFPFHSSLVPDLAWASTWKAASGKVAYSR